MTKEYFIEYLYSRFLLSRSVSIDTRTLEPDDLYFALKGLRYDGHTFLKEALDKGASYAVVSEEASVPKALASSCIRVPDTLKALQDMASFHRSRYKRPLIAITGSNGKTTTCSLVAQALGARYNVHQSIKSHNNHIGVPLTLLHILPQTEIAVLEFGTSSPGEIGRLCELAKPTHGLITHIGASHLAGLGDVAGVAKEKRTLYNYLESHQGQFFLNTQCPALSDLALRAVQQPPNPSQEKGDTHVFTYGGPNDDYPLTYLSSTPTLHYAFPSGLSAEVALTGKHHFLNLAAALAIGRAFEVPEQDLSQALSTWRGPPLRGEWTTCHKRRVFVDCYNANPDSMHAALHTFIDDASARKTKVLILGDMLDLGEASSKAHQALGQFLTKHQNAFEAVWLCGKEMAAAHNTAPHALYFPDKTTLRTHLESHPLASNCTLLLKGSRGMALESVLDWL